jgi:fibronectin-binding autotransporter adhesin
MQHRKNATATRSSQTIGRGIAGSQRINRRLNYAAASTVAALGTMMSGLFGLSSGYGALVTTTGVDAAGAAGFNTADNWSNGLAPAAGNAYQVLGGGKIRTPTTGGNLTFAGDSLTLGDGSVAGFGSLTFKGNPGDTITIGNLTLNSGSVQSGGTAAGAVNPWTLTTTDPVNNPIIIGSGGFAVDNGGVAGRTVTFAANLSGSGALQVVGTTTTNTINGGTLMLTGNNVNWTGNELITGGALQVGIGGTAGTLGTGAINDDNVLAFDITSSETYAQTVTVDAANTGTISNISTGTVGFTNASGIAVNGTLALANSTGALTFTGPITNSGGGNLTVTNGGGIVSMGGVTGTGDALIITGTGTTTLTGPNSYTGNTTINGGTLAITGSGTIPVSPTYTIAANSTFDFHTTGGTLTTGSTQTITGGGTIVGNVSSGGFLQPGNGATVGTLAITGNLAITGGTLSTTLSATSTAPANNDLIAVTGNLTLTGTTNLNPSFVGSPLTPGTMYDIISFTGMESGPSTDFVVQNRSISVSITPAAGITPGEVVATVTNNGAASLTWNATSSSANDNWDIVNDANWLNTGTHLNDRFYQGDNVTFNDTVAGVDQTVNLTQAVSPGSITVNSTANSYVFTATGTGTITGGGAMNVTLGTNPLTIAESNDSYAGPITINSGTVQVGNGGTVGSLGTGTIVNNGTLLYARSDAPTVANVINGSGSLVFGSGSGGAALTGANGYLGGTTITSGTVFPDNNSAFGAATSPVVVTSGSAGQIYTVQANTYAQPIQIGGSGPTNVNGAFLGALRAGGAVVSTFSGPVTVAALSIINVDSGATLLLSNTNALSASGNLAVEATGAGTLAFGGNVNLGANSIIDSTIAIELEPPTATTINISTLIQDTASINQNGAGTSVISSSNTYSGATTITNGMLLLSTNGQISNSTSSITTFGNANTGTGVIGLTGGNVFNLGNGLPITVEGRSGTTAQNASIDNVSGNNTLQNTINTTVGGAFYAVQSDSGLLTMSGAYTPTGGTGNRFLQLQGNGAGNWSGPMSDGATGDTITVIESSASGTGSWTLSNASGNTFSGGAIIVSGTLNVANTSGSATGTGTVQMYGGVLASSTPQASVTGVVAAGTVTNPVIGTNTLTLAPAASIIAPGGLLNVGSLSVGGLITSNLTTLNFDLGTGSGEITNGDLLTLGSSSGTIGAGTPISVAGGSPVFGDDYRIIGGNLTGIPTSALSNFVLPSAPAGLAYSLSESVDPGYIDLVVIHGGPANLIWNNTLGGGNGTLWDNVQQNWENGASAAVYTDVSPGSNVTFNDNNHNNYAVTLNSTVTPISVTVNNSSNNYTISGTGRIAGAATTLTKLGSDVLTLSNTGINTYGGGTTVSAGTLLIGAAGALPAASSVSVTGGTLQLGTGTGLETLSSLSITGGTFDVNNDHIIISYQPGTQATADATIRGYLASGYNAGGGGSWNGPGLDSSAANALFVSGNKHYGLGYADGADMNGSSPVVAGLGAGNIEVKYTLYGDANLDGVVNGTDFGILAAHFGDQVTAWDEGDFNYDGVVNGTDFGALAANFGQQASGTAIQLPAADYAALDAFAAANGLMADVPEPATIGLLTLGTIGVLSRRRRHAR